MTRNILSLVVVLAVIALLLASPSMGKEKRPGDAGARFELESRLLAEDPEVKQALEPYWNDPIDKYADLIHSNGWMGALHQFCWAFLR